jgi:hypothetical protein
MFHCSRRFKMTRKKTLSNSKRKARQVFLDHDEPICFLSLVTLLHASLKLNTYFDTFRIGIYGSVELLCPTFLRVIEVFHLYDVEFGLCWVLRVLAFHLSWCEVTMVRFDVVVWAWVGMVEMVGIRQVTWLVILKSAKDWILGVDTPGQ